MRVGERAQLGKAGRLGAARRDREVEAERIVELAAGDIRRCCRRQRRLRPEPGMGVAARYRIAEATRQARDEAFGHGGSECEMSVRKS